MNARTSLASLCLLAACAPAAIDLDAARTSLQEAVEGYHQSAAAADADAVMAWYAADGAMMPPNGPDQAGPTAVRSQIDGFTSLEDFLKQFGQLRSAHCRAVYS